MLDDSPVLIIFIYNILCNINIYFPFLLPIQNLSYIGSNIKYIYIY